METRANLITVGLFVLAVIAAGFAGAYWLLKGTQSGPRAVVALVFNGSVSGLLPGAAVFYNGIKIGEVSSVGFAAGEANRVVAYLAVDRHAPLKTDSKAALGFTGLTGYATVQIVGGSNDARLLLDKTDGVPELFADTSSTQDLVQGAKRIMGQADQTLTTLQQLLADNGPSVTKTIKNAEVFSESLARNSGTIDKFMGSVGQAADVLSRVSGKIETLTEDVDVLVKAVDRDKVARVIDDVSRVSGNLASSSERMAGAIDDARGAITDVRKVIAAIDPQKVGGAIDDLAKVTHDLAKSSDKIEALVSDSQGTMSDARKLLAAVDPGKVSKVVDDVARISGDLARSSGDVQGLMQQARSALDGVKDLSTNLNGTVTEVRKVVAAVDPAKVASTVDDVSRLSRHLSEKTQDFDDLLAHARSASANVDAFTADVAKKSPQVSQIIDDTASAMRQIEVASHRVDGILANIDGVVGSDAGKGLFEQGRGFLAEATEAAKAFKVLSQTYTGKAEEISAALRGFTAQGLREVKDFVADSRKTLGTIDRAVSEFDRNPQRLLLGTNRGNVPEYGPGRR